MSEETVLIVGGGFAGVTCAQQLAKHDVNVILLDRNNYHQFQPLLYQVATAQLAAYDIARPLRGIFRHHATVDVRHTPAAAIDPETRSVTTTSGSVLSADYLVVAAGAEANFFDTAGAAEHSLPLYSVNDAEKLRARILDVMDATVERPELIDQGSLNFVIVGGGPTGVETAGALAEALRDVVPEEYQSLSEPATVHLVDHGEVLLGPFSDKAMATPRSERAG
jgi:NADH dehydrogenase